MTNPLKPQKSKEFFEYRRTMTDYILMLCALCAVAVINYGAKAVWIMTLSVLTCFVLRGLGGKILKIEEPVGDLSSLVTGLATALLMPASAPWWLVVCTAAFAVTVCVLPFGNARNSPFVPAAAAVCFASLCWSDALFAYPRLSYDTYFNAQDMGVSLSRMLSQGNSIGRNAASVLEVMTGNIPSPIGAGCIIALGGALVYLIIRRPKNSIPALTFLISASAMALAFPRVSSGRAMSLLMELCGGMLLFSAIFFMTSPTVMPKRLLPRALWGFAGGIICMLTRYFGFLEESVCFGIIITQALSGFFDSLPLTRREKKALAAQDIYTEIPATVVPDIILDDIPDIPDEPEQEESSSAAGDGLPREAESLDAVISEENTVSETQAPFITGGDGDE